MSEANISDLLLANGDSLPSDQSHVVMALRVFQFFQRGTVGPDASYQVLVRRACYGGRKGNSARRRLGFRPSTSARAFRTQQLLNALGGKS